MDSNYTTLPTTRNIEDLLGPKRDTLTIVIPITITYMTIFITGCLGNISTCLVIAKNKSMHTATNYYLFSLAISDLVLLISGLPEEIYSIWSRYPYIFGSTFCFSRGLLAETSVNASILTITAFTVERYLAICHPFISHTMSKLSRAIRFILCIWILSCLLAVPQAMQFKIKQILPWSEESVVCMFEPIFFHSLEVSTMVFFVAPMTVITVLYVLIGLKLKTSQVVARRNTSVHSKTSKKILKMLVAVVVAFFICWVPFHIQRLFTKYSTQYVDKENHSIYLNIYVVLTYTSGVLYYLSATINPILYNIMSVKFRNAFTETFSKCCGVSVCQSNGPQRRYSVLSRSAGRGNGRESTTESGAREDSSTQANQCLDTNQSLVNASIETTAFLDKRRANVPFYFSSKEFKMDSPTKGMKTTQKLNENVDKEDLKIVSLHIKEKDRPKGKKWLDFCHCISENNLANPRQITAYYSSPSFNTTNECKRIDSFCRHDSSCEISNSSLKDVEIGALEDELTAYMRKIRQREQQGF